MKKSILLMLSVALVLFAGCKKHQWRPTAGEQIRFQAVTESASSSTKTVYSGEYYDTSIEHIDWVEGDKISVAYVSYNVSGQGPVDMVGLSDDYVISGIKPFDRTTNPSARSKAELTPANGNGLVWQDRQYHGFFGTYPDLTGDLDFRFGVDDSKGVIYHVPFHFPAEQFPVSSGDSTLKLTSGSEISCVRYNPDMQYAYMTAFAKDFVTLDDPVVNLNFKTEYIAYEFSADMAGVDPNDDEEELTVNSFTLTDAAGNLVGDFMLRTKEEATADDPEDERLPVANASPAVSFFFNEDKDPITITEGTPIVFTVFTGIDWTRFISTPNRSTQLTITFNIVDKNGDNVNRSLKLQDNNGNWISFDQWDSSSRDNQGIKHRIYGLKIPLELKNEPNGWFESPSAGGYTNQDW